MLDLHNLLNASRAISPVSVADNTAQVSQIIDLAGYEALEFVLVLGSLADADATFTVLVEECTTSGGTYTAVADADLLGTEAAASFTFAADDTVKKIGYVGHKQYVRLTVTPAANASAAVLAVVALRLGRSNPQA